MLEFLNQIDTSVFLFLNGMHNEFFDFLMYWITKQETWYPFYTLIIIWMFWKYKLKALLPFLMIILGVVISDQFTSGFMKPFFERLRPCHDSDINQLVHIVAGCGGLYGFASGHASNSFFLAFLLFFFFRTQFKYPWLIFIWAALVSYSRVYVGVHYPGDIIVGGLIGYLVAVLLYWTYNRFPENRKIHLVYL